MSAEQVITNSLWGDCCYVCESGEGTVYHLDEMTGALVISHTLVISSKDYPGMLPVTGVLFHYRSHCYVL